MDFFFFLSFFFGLNGIWTNYDDHDEDYVIYLGLLLFELLFLEDMDLNFSERDYYVSRAGKYLLEYRSNIC